MFIKTSAKKRVLLSIPKGAEGAVRAIGHHECKIKLKRYDEGLVSIVGAPEKKLVEILNNTPRWSFGAYVQFDVGDDLSELSSSLEAYIDINKLAGKSYWVNSPDNDKKSVKRIVDYLINQSDLEILNNPSQYELVLEVRETKNKIIVLMGKSFSVKERFSYRIGDVSASINPVLAALLVRLVPKYPEGVTIDPTCGSGTLLYERLLHSKSEHGIGIDKNPKALAVATENLSHCSLTDVASRTNLFRADATTQEVWRDSNLVICNLPFGVRINMTNPELMTLYSNILSNGLKNLRENGRILAVTSFKYGIERSIKNQIIKAKILAHYKIWSGGLVYQTYVISKA